MTTLRRYLPRLVAAGLVLAVSTGMGGCEGRPRGSSSEQAPAPLNVDSPAVVEIDLTRGLPEVVPSSLFGAARQRSHLDLVRTMRALREKDSTKAVFVRFGSATLSLARAHEIGRLLGEMRTKGLSVICHADDYTNGSMLLAAVGCSKLWVSPAGSVDTVGIAAQLIYGHKLLTKLQVDVDFLQVGKFKGAQEPFTRDGPSPEARASLERTLGGLRTSWLEAIDKGRAKKGVVEAVEDGPFPAEQAKERGLVDEVGYADDARDDAKKAGGVERVAVRFGGGDAPPPMGRGMVEVFRALSGAGQGGTPHVAVVRAVGAITMASNPSLLGGSEGITERELGKVITKLTNDASTKAVVLRIDSPGGSALASDLLWKKLMKLRAEKPVVVSVAGMAASGGYYLSCTASKIVAEPTSIVGSIGVVGGKFSVGKALEEVGINAVTVAASPDPGAAARAAYLSPFTPWDDATRARMLASMTAIYDLFLKRVAEGRGQTVEKIAESAEGQIFGGVDAKARGLVDELGGLDDALRIALELGGLPPDAPIHVVGDSPGFFDLLDGGEQNGAAAASAELGRSAGQAAVDAVLPQWARLGPEVMTFVTSATPVMEGERTLTALPFVLMVR